MASIITHHHLKHIVAAIRRSALSPEGQERAVGLFERLAQAEAAIHNTPIERVHLHEVGALDSIIDIVGAVYGFEWFGIDDIVASPLNVGGGTVRVRARHVPRAGAGDGAPALGRAGLRQRHDASWSRRPARCS